ncbi:M48 family metallopeptidase [Dolosigranulum pigrum]|uniref:M48 family metallopeptidase n=1 Tax=Dolosigranulum pigrum TaxID=29394 RepID=UPI001AD871E1|nr:SprT family zinc-dependent metalloprotease [Dolosigranulum pigrum]QTJ51621.1 M48 family metallopeptidase [Dolosigranulum pigrum]
MKYKQTIGGIEIEILKKNNLKNLYIRIIPPKGDVKVSVPSTCSDEEIRNVVLKKIPEITKIREKFQKQPRQTKREYVSGESYYLWGKPYRLEVIYGNKKSEVKKTPRKIVLKVPEGTGISKRELIITEWYRAEIKRVLEIVSKKCEKNTGLKANEYRVKNMKTRWGTCNIDKKRIWINLQLAKKPMECLEYVLTHELVHLIEKNHTNRFHALVEEFYPTWKEARKLLSKMPLDYVEKDDCNE